MLKFDHTPKKERKNGVSRGPKLKVGHACVIPLETYNKLIYDARQCTKSCVAR